MRNEDIPVIRRIPTNREDVFAFAIEGHLDDASLENLYGLLDAAYETHEEIDLLIRLTGYEGFDWTAAFSESMLSMRSKSLKKLRHYAIVSSPVDTGQHNPHAAFPVDRTSRFRSRRRKRGLGMAECRPTDE